MSMFGSIRNSTPPPATGETPGYWDELEQHHARHRRHVVVLAIVCVLILLAALVVHPAFAGLTFFILPLLLLELFMVRRSRPTMKIPDYRPSPRVDVELDVRPDSSPD